MKNRAMSIWTKSKMPNAGVTSESSCAVPGSTSSPSLSIDWEPSLTVLQLLFCEAVLDRAKKAIKNDQNAWAFEPQVLRTSLFKAIYK